MSSLSNFWSPEEDADSGCFETCTDRRCKLCPPPPNTQTHHLVIQEHEYKARVKSIRETQLQIKKNVVFLITCGVCGKQYMNATKDKLNMRVHNHRLSITTNNIDLSVGRHYNLDNYSLEDMIVVGIDHDPSWTTEQRVAKENFYQQLLMTIKPQGLNKTFDAFEYKKRLLLRCIHHFISDLIYNMDHMRISGTEPSSVILSQIM